MGTGISENDEPRSLEWRALIDDGHAFEYRAARRTHTRDRSATALLLAITGLALVLRF